jgi:guanylate kinase
MLTLIKVIEDPDTMRETEQHKIIILTAPSGAGKTTIKTRLLAGMAEQLSFSVSATTRKMRGGETDGVDYIFISEELFKEKINNDQFVEWQMVYPGMYYGTTVDEMKRIWSEGKTPLLDIDVKGALNVKKMFGTQVLTIFIEPPSIEILQERLMRRGTESAEHINTRISKAKEEMEYRNSFDRVIMNDDLERATNEVNELIANFLG